MNDGHNTLHGDVQNSTRLKIVHSVIDFFSADGSTDEDIEGQVFRFRGDFIIDQLPTMIHVTDTAFNNIKAKAP